MVTPCINNIQHFNFQLMHTTLKNVFYTYIIFVQNVVNSSQFFFIYILHVCRFITVTICSHNTDNVQYSLHVSTFNQVCNF